MPNSSLSKNPSLSSSLVEKLRESEAVSSAASSLTDVASSVINFTSISMISEESDALVSASAVISVFSTEDSEEVVKVSSKFLSSSATVFSTAESEETAKISSKFLFSSATVFSTGKSEETAKISSNFLSSSAAVFSTGKSEETAKISSNFLSSSATVFSTGKSE
jgi:hypothetical protein